MTMRKIISLLLAVTAVCALCACGGGQEQKDSAADSCLKSYLTENAFTVEENGVQKFYADHEAVEKLYGMYTAEGNTEMLSRFTTVEDVLLKMEKTAATGKETVYCQVSSQGVLERTCHSEAPEVFFTYHYDEAGRLTEKKQYRVGTAEPEAVCTYKYDEYGNCIRYQDEKNKVLNFKYTYDDAGVILTGPRVEFLPEGALLSDTIRYTYEYDEAGSVIRMAGQQTNGKDIYYEFVYDDRGRATQVTNIMPEGDVTEVYRYEGDRLVEWTQTRKGETAVHTYTYGTRYILDTQGLE